MFMRYIQRLPLRIRFLLGAGAILVPMMVLSVAGYVLFTKVAGTTDASIEEVRDQLLPVARLQTLLQRAAMPPNDWLIHGNPREQTDFAAISKNIDQVFVELLGSPIAEAEKTGHIAQARENWHAAKTQAATLFDLSYPIADMAAAADKMEAYDTTIDAATEHLDKVYVLVQEELAEQHAQVHLIKRWIQALIFGAFLFSALLVFFGALILSRTIIQPIHTLDDSAALIGAGELNHRVPINSDDELGRLARTFNEMAGKLEQLAIRDGLTGLYNKREFDRRLHEELERARRNGRPFALLMIDADYFKKINDDYGHLAGDRVLRKLANLLSQGVRPVDHAARYGGEEFAIILPETSTKEANKTAERLRRAVQMQEIVLDGDRRIRITVSIGLAGYPRDAASAKALVAAADEAMYAAKAGGRNLVRQFVATTSEPSAAYGTG